MGLTAAVTRGLAVFAREDFLVFAAMTHLVSRWPYTQYPYCMGFALYVGQSLIHATTITNTLSARQVLGYSVDLMEHVQLVDSLGYRGTAFVTRATQERGVTS